MTIKIFKRSKNGIFKITLCEKGLELYQSKRWQFTSHRAVMYLGRKVRKKPLKRRTIIFHRALLNLEDKNLHVDHINGDGLDNRLCNLRIVTLHQNRMNRRKRALASSKHKGVHWNKKHQTWYASVRYNNKRNFLGKFETEDLAAQAYNKKALELFGEYANLNIVN